jgi:hypothetical protein
MDNDKNQVITIEDKGLTYVRLTHAGSYLIDGELFEKDSPYGVKEIRCKNPDDIRMVDIKLIITHYEKADGDNLSINSYEIRKNELHSKGWYDEEDGWQFKNLDDEYDYKKFILNWKPIQKTIQTISEPIKLEKINIKYNTGNPYITNRFLNGTNDNLDLYEYNRKAALWSIIRVIFESIGFEYQKDVGYKGTEGKKIWSGDDPEYVVAFGLYVFGNRNQLCLRNSIGTLDDMLEKYEVDKRRIKSDIMKHYNSLYKDNSNFDFSSLLHSLERARSKMFSLKIHKTQSNIGEYGNAMQSINHSIKMVSDFLTKD